MVKYELKSDRYGKTRGGHARFLNLYCLCGTHLMLYQKDGPQPLKSDLKRLYLDRIFAPEKLNRLQRIHSLTRIPKLRCTGCRRQLGIPYIYDKEPRIAFKLELGTVTKRLSNGTYPPAALKR